jgi:DNA-binding transcriptional regulator YiaG
MLCPICNLPTLEKVGRYRYQECGLDNVWLGNCPMRVCPQCKGEYPELPDALTTAKAIAKILIVQPYQLNGSIVLFLRNLMCFTSEQFAMLLGTTRQEVSRWENKRNALSPLFDFRLRLIVVERLFPVGEQIPIQQEINRVIRVAYKDEIADAGEVIQVPLQGHQAYSTM